MTTAGELSTKAARDTTLYDPVELGHAFVEDLDKRLRECIENHRKQIQESDQEEMCIVYLTGSDLILHNLIRRKFYMWPWLPKPRPNQTVFLYNKSLDCITKLLWALPNPKTMAELTYETWLPQHSIRTRTWCDSFFRGTFWDDIRKMHNIKMQSEHEIVRSHNSEMLKSGINATDTSVPESFDFSKIAIKKLVDSQQIVA